MSNKVKEGLGRSWKVLEGHGRSRKVNQGHGSSFPITRFTFQSQSQSLSSGLWIWDLDLRPGFGTWIWDWTWAWQLHCTDMYKSQIQKLISYVLLCNTKVTYILSPSIALVCSKSYKYFNTIIKITFWF